MSALRSFIEILKQGGAAAPSSAGAAPAASPVLKSIAISPLNPSLMHGVPRGFRADGTFSDGSTKTVTTSVEWSSSADKIVSIDSKGVATAQADAGSAVITAKDPSNPSVPPASTTATAAPNPVPILPPDEDAKAEIFADMEKALSKKPPDEAALKSLVAAGGDKVLDLLVKDKAKPEFVAADGGKVLDALVKLMPDPPDRATITAAIEARFNIKMKDTDATTQASDVEEGNKSIKQIYLTMLLVPDADVRNNPSLKEIDRQPGKSYPYYEPDTKKAVLPLGRASDPGNPIGNTTDRTDRNGKFHPAELDKVDADCQPSATPPPTYLGWSTLHEVAHGVDDKKNIMNGKGGNAFADWKTHSLDEVAAVGAAWHGYDEGYVKALLSGTPAGSLKPAPKPDNIKNPEVWEGRRLHAVAWCSAVVVGNELWMKAAESKTHAIGKDHRVYQQGGPGDTWVSYKLDARSQGITGYQFRAAGEWFSELYAAYYTGMLKPSHPFVPWIKKVEK